MAVIVKNAIRALVKGKYNVSEEYLKALDADVATLVRKAGERARANGRRTLKARDI